MLQNLHFRPSSFKNTISDITAFVLGLGIAWLQKWQTVDLVWSLWLSSLVIGYLSILSTIGAGVYIGYRSNKWRKNSFLHMSQSRHLYQSQLHHLYQSQLPRLYQRQLRHRLFYALFLFGFFSLHFSGYHFGLALILNTFFPLETSPQNLFDYNFINPLSVWKLAIKHVIPLYGLFIIPVLIAERKGVFGALIQASSAIRRGKKPDDPFEHLGQIQKTEAKIPPASHFAGPYINAMRIQLSIVFFVIFGFMRIVDPRYVMVIVYTVYFFPWSAFFIRKNTELAHNRQ